MKSTDQQLAGALDAAGHGRAAEVVREDAELPSRPETPEEAEAGLRQGIRRALVEQSAAKQAQHAGIARMFGYAPDAPEQAEEGGEAE